MVWSGHLRIFVINNYVYVGTCEYKYSQTLELLFFQDKSIVLCFSFIKV